MAMEGIWKTCYEGYQLSLQSMPTRSHLEPFFVNFKNPNFLHTVSSKDDADLFDEHGRRKDGPYIWPPGFLDWLSSNKDVKAPTAAFLKAYPMKSKATGPPDKSYQQMFIGSLIWSEYKELKCSILKAGPWWLPHKLPSGRNISSLYYSVRRAMLMKEFRSAAQGSVRQQRKRFTDAKQLPSKTMKKSKKTDVIVGKGDAAAGDCVTVSPDLTSAIALSSSSDAPSSSNVFDQTRALDLIIADKLATLEKDRKSKYSYYPNYWLPFLLFGPANEAPLASFIATVKPAYVKAESGAHTSAMGRSARRVSSAMTAGHQFGGEYSPLIVQQVLSDANSLSVVAAKNNS